MKFEDIFLQILKEQDEEDPDFGFLDHPVPGEDDFEGGVHGFDDG